MSILLLILAVPGLLLGYPVGISFGAYGPWMIWLLVTGVCLVRGGRTKVVAI